MSVTEPIARIAAQRADAAALARLDEALAAHHRLADERGRLAGDPASFVDGDREFHVAIAAMTGNPVFPAIVDAMFRWLSGHYRALVRAPGAESLTLREHDDIRDAIARGDPQAAVDYISSMTDRFALQLFQELFVPSPWPNPHANAQISR